MILLFINCFVLKRFVIKKNSSRGMATKIFPSRLNILEQFQTWRIRVIYFKKSQHFGVSSCWEIRAQVALALLRKFTRGG